MKTVLVILALIVLVFFFWKFKSRRLFDPEALMPGYAQKAISTAKEKYGLTLDLDEKNLKVLEMKIMRPLSEEFKKKALSDEELANNCILWGAYLGEMLKKASPYWSQAHWRLNDSEKGQQTINPNQIGLAGKDFVVYPGAWVQKHIEDPINDNFVGKYELAYQLPNTDQNKKGTQGQLIDKDGNPIKMRYMPEK